LRKLLFQKKVFLHGEKENFEEYSLILEFAELSFPILNNYLAEMCRPCPRATVYGGKARVKDFKTNFSQRGKDKQKRIVREFVEISQENLGHS
jgi:hypothetical protein